MNPSVAILASGEGTTAEAVIREWQKRPDAPRVRLIISSNPKAGVFGRIKRLSKELGTDIRVETINSQTHPGENKPGEQTSAEQQAILDLTKDMDLIVLMGYMKKVGPKVVQRLGWRSEYTKPQQAKMLNTHPGLLPDTKSQYGIHVQEYVLSHNLPYSGQTLHVVAENYDEGPTIAEHKVDVDPDDTPATLFDKVRSTEKKYLPEDIEKFIQRRQHEGFDRRK